MNELMNWQSTYLVQQGPRVLGHREFRVHQPGRWRRQVQRGQQVQRGHHQGP